MVSRKVLIPSVIHVELFRPVGPSSLCKSITGRTPMTHDPQMKSLPPKPPNGFGGAPPPNPPPPPGKRGPPRPCGGPPPGPMGSYLAPGGTLQRGMSANAFSGKSTWGHRCVLSVVAPHPTSSPTKQRIVECRMHASTARSKPSTSQWIMGPESRRI